MEEEGQGMEGDVKRISGMRLVGGWGLGWSGRGGGGWAGWGGQGWGGGCWGAFGGGMGVLGVAAASRYIDVRILVISSNWEGNWRMRWCSPPLLSSENICSHFCIK